VPISTARIANSHSLSGHVTVNLEFVTARRRKGISVDGIIGGWYAECRRRGVRDIQGRRDGRAPDQLYAETEGRTSGLINGGGAETVVWTGALASG
jgi:hypothetical protein